MDITKSTGYVGKRYQLNLFSLFFFFFLFSFPPPLLFLNTKYVRRISEVLSSFKIPFFVTFFFFFFFFVVAQSGVKLAFFFSR